MENISSININNEGNNEYLYNNKSNKFVSKLF